MADVGVFKRNLPQTALFALLKPAVYMVVNFRSLCVEGKEVVLQSFHSLLQCKKLRISEFTVVIRNVRLMLYIL